MALLEICARIVSWLFNEQMVLEHLLGNESGQESLVLLRCDLGVVDLLSGCFFQASFDLLGCVVILSTIYVFIQGRITVPENSIDKLACEVVSTKRRLILQVQHLPVSSAISMSGNLASLLTGIAKDSEPSSPFQTD